MIPKIIHYCWLSDAPIPEKYQAYINGWKKLMPEYQIKKWDRQTINLEEHDFALKAFNDKKYAFAADYIRVYALRNEGGIYLDSDVEVIKPLDKFLKYGFFSSFENHLEAYHYKLLQLMGYIDNEGKRRHDVTRVVDAGIQAAIIGSEAHHPFIEKLYETYISMNWDEYKERKKTFSAPIIFAQTCENFGFRNKDKKQELAANTVIFPSDVFCMNGDESDNTYAIHKCAGSWNKRENESGLKHALRCNKLIKSLYMSAKILMKKTN